jgi:hypothetical protein
MYLIFLNLAIALLEHGPDAYHKLIADLHQRGELTDEQAAALTARMEAAFAAPHWKTDEQL